MLGIHNLRDDGETRGLPGLQEKADALLVEALESVGRCPGLEGSATKDLCPSGLHTLGHGDNLLLVFHGTGARHHQEVAAADLSAGGEVDDRVRLVEFAVGAFIGLLDPADSLHDIQSHDALHIYPGGVAYQSHNGVILTYRDMGLQPHTVEPGAEHLHLLLFRVFFQYDDHIFSPFPAQGLEFFE